MPHGIHTKKTPVAAEHTASRYQNEKLMQYQIGKKGSPVSGSSSGGLWPNSTARAKGAYTATYGVCGWFYRVEPERSDTQRSSGGQGGGEANRAERVRGTRGSISHN
jgi:hypothetical protein